MRRQGYRVLVLVAVVGFLAARGGTVAADELHTIAPGETVAAIAAAHGVSPQTVLDANGTVDPANLLIGEQLVIPTEAAAVIVPGIAPYQQQRSLSCEYASVYIATAAFGAPVSEWDSIAATPQDANPHRGFRGSIDGWWGNTTDYGIYAEALVPNLAQHGFGGEVTYGADPAILRAQLDAGRPTIVWLGFWGDTGFYETDADGNTYKLVPGYHNVVAYGYDADGVYVADPGTGTLQYFGWGSFADMWAVMDGMALAISPA